MNRLRCEIKAQKQFYGLIAFIQIICVIAICFVVGLLLNNEYLSLESDRTTLVLEVSLDDPSDGMTVSEMEPMLEELLEILNRKYTGVEYSSMEYTEEDGQMSINIVCDWFNYRDGVYSKGDQYRDRIERQIVEGRGFQDADYETASETALIFGNFSEQEGIGGTVSLYGRTYQVIGVRETKVSESMQGQRVVSIPVTAWGDIPVTEFTIYLRCMMSNQNKKDVEAVLEKWYGDAGRYVNDYAAENKDLKAAYRTTFLISAVMLFAAFGVLYMLYGYLFTHRRRKIAIYALCGCSRWRCIGDYTLENMLFGAVTTTVGLLIFCALEKLWLGAVYPYMDDIFTGGLLLGCFFGMLLLCTLQGFLTALVHVRRNVMEMLKV
jgi:hypothetical protein